MQDRTAAPAEQRPIPIARSQRSRPVTPTFEANLDRRLSPAVHGGGGPLRRRPEPSQLSVLGLQRTIGNRATASLLGVGPSIRRQPAQMAGPQPAVGAAPPAMEPGENLVLPPELGSLAKPPELGGLQLPEVTLTRPSRRREASLLGGESLPALRVDRDTARRLLGLGIRSALATKLGLLIDEDLSVHPTRGTQLKLRDNWSAIRADIVRAAVVAHGHWRVPAAKVLHLPPAVEALLLQLSPPERVRLADEVFDDLVRLGSHGALRLQDVRSDLRALGPFTASLITGGEAGYPTVREGLLATFGSLIVARSYYEKVLVNTKFLGNELRVHPELKAALDRAEDVYVKAQPDVPATRVDGLAIRVNVNNPRVLSFHSLGWAIDVKPDTNPNVPLRELAAQGVPNVWELVREVTGGDVFTRDPKGRSVRGPETGTVAEATAEADRLKQISSEFQSLFKDAEAWRSGIVDYAAREGLELTPAQGEELSAELREVTPKRAASAAQQTESRLFGWWLVNRRTARAREQAAHPLGLPALSAPAPFPPDMPRLAPDFKRIAATAVQMALAFTASRTKTGELVPASAIASLGSFAAHGFMDMDPLLVGALAGSDPGGGLAWLGKTVSGTRDTMHFELKRPPPLPHTAPDAGAPHAERPT